MPRLYVFLPLSYTAISLLAGTLLLAGCQREAAPREAAPREATATATATATTAETEVAAQGGNPWRQDCEMDIAAIESDIEKLEALDGPYTVDSVLEPLNAIETRIADGAGAANLMENVHPEAAIREHARECTSAYADLATRLSLSRGIYDAVSAVDERRAPADTRRYHALTLQVFRLAGVDRNDATREQIRDLNDRITRLGQEFDKNILEDVRYIEVAPEELAGLPEDFIADRAVNEEGKVRLSTRYVDTIPVYTYVHSDRVRKLLRQQERSRGYPANQLGFDNFADYVTSDKMIGSGENAHDFIQRVHDLAQPAAAADLKVLLERLRQINPDAETVQRWQTSYLEELIRRERYDIDAAELRQYFSYGKVKEGIFALVEHLFDVEITPWKTDTWHPAVESFEMRRAGELIGRFYLDMHPREGKYQHAAAFTYKTGIEGKQLPVSALVCNFAGGGNPGAPMEYREVNTFLHEFGHLLHSLFGGHQRWARISGIATEWDFVEAPSQMLEEWLYDYDTLKTFAVNDQGEPIPRSLVDNLRAARLFGEGAKTNVQMYYAALSLEYHRLPPESFDLKQKMLELEAAYSPYPHQENTYFFANLGHLNGYSALYYTYMWSKVIAMDMFSRFDAAGLRDPATAREYRDTVLMPGGLKPAGELVEDFLGRPYNFEAFSRRLTDSEQL